GGALTAVVVQFRACVCHVAAAALDGLDGRERIGAAAGGLLCHSLLPGQRDVHLFDLGADGRARRVAAGAQAYAGPSDREVRAIRVCCGCRADVDAGGTRHLALLLDRVSTARSPGIAGARRPCDATVGGWHCVSCTYSTCGRLRVAARTRGLSRRTSHS